MEDSNNKIAIKRKIEEKEWKNKNPKYLFELQKFLDIAENIQEETLRKEVINQMLRCDKTITELAEDIFLKILV